MTYDDLKERFPTYESALCEVRRLSEGHDRNRHAFDTLKKQAREAVAARREAEEKLAQVEKARDELYYKLKQSAGTAGGADDLLSRFFGKF